MLRDIWRTCDRTDGQSCWKGLKDAAYAVTDAIVKDKCKEVQPEGGRTEICGEVRGRW